MPVDDRQDRGYLQVPDDPWYLRFHDLMPYKIHEILLVSSAYDAFTLEEDGRLTARLFVQYSELDLSWAPRITRVATAAGAMELLRERRFDLVITMVHLEDVDVYAFAQKVKSEFPELPVVLFAFQEAELALHPQANDWWIIDRVFLWTGDTHILIAAIKIIEDHRNVVHDAASGVRVVIFVEDSVRRYSSFLSMLYGELLVQAGSLVAEGVNDLHKRMRLRARPKILLATTYEEAHDLYRRYRNNVLAVISDVRFPRGGSEDAEAGFKLARTLREYNADLPLLLQSAEPQLAARAHALGAAFADKNSPHLLRRLRRFLIEDLGFGEFVFRLPDRTEIARARDVYEMETLLHSVPGASLEYHATRNHFSMWLTARCMFRLAEEIRPRTVEDFGGAEGMREHLIAVLRKARLQDQAGAITDFSARQRGIGSILRLGKGSIGGKGRSIAFVSSLLVRHQLVNRFPGLEIRIPRTVMIGTEEFDRFIEINELTDVPEMEDDREILERFLNARLHGELVHELDTALRHLHGPLSVRSSSLLEDSYLKPFAGIYSTYMLPHVARDPEVRLRQLCQAVKAVYASTFFQRSKSYIAGTPFAPEDEKMGVIVQQLVGERRGSRFYPTLSGIACSYNYYPVGSQRADDGVCAVAMGLGHTVVSGGASVKFSPLSPGVLPQFPTAEDFLRHSQRSFYAVDMARETFDFLEGENAALGRYDLNDAEEDGVLQVVGSVYCAGDETIRDGLSAKGPRVVTFNNLLKWRAIPFAEALAELLKRVREGMGRAVEVEFALNIPSWHNEDGQEMPARLYPLQVRPQAVQPEGAEVYGRVEELPTEHLLCRTNWAMGHGCIEGIRDIVYVESAALERIGTPAAAAEVGQLNALLKGQRRPYLLIGPGRWGSSDPRLGIPVDWSQISGVKVVVEVAFEGRFVEPSQGSHFFHNLTAMDIGYLAHTGPGRAESDQSWLFDRDWLYQQPVGTQLTAVRHIELEESLTVLLDGRRSKGVILKPTAPRQEVFD